MGSRQLVIRYNSIYADNNRLNGVTGLDRPANGYYDVIFTASSQDVDIYSNIIRNATDDLIEADNYAVNVRIYGNYLDSGLTAISHQSMQAGPAYIFRNVFDRGAGADSADYVGLSKQHWAALSDRALKISLDNGNAATAMFNGPLYVVHNTMLRTDMSGFKTVWSILPGNAAKWQSNLKLITSRNNVFMLGRHYLRDEQASARYERYYFADLHNQAISSNPFVDYRMTGTCADGGDCVATAAWLAGHGPGAGASAAWPPTGRYRIANALGDGAAIASFNGVGNRTRGCPRRRCRHAIRARIVLESGNDRLTRASAPTPYAGAPRRRRWRAPPGRRPASSGRTAPLQDRPRPSPSGAPWPASPGIQHHQIGETARLDRPDASRPSPAPARCRASSCGRPQRRQVLAAQLQHLVAFGGRPQHGIAGAAADIGRQRHPHRIGPPLSRSRSNSPLPMNRLDVGQNTATDRLSDSRLDLVVVQMDAMAEQRPLAQQPIAVVDIGVVARIGKSRRTVSISRRFSDRCVCI